MIAGTTTLSGWRLFLVMLSILAVTPAKAHHQQTDGPIRGVAIPAIAHGEMPVVARYQSEILALAAREPLTDPTLRRLAGFISLQTFACFWGLVPGSLSDEASPFNECTHAYLAGTSALLTHMSSMPGDQSAAKALDARMSAEIASDPAANIVCSNSTETFDSADVIGPDWRLAPAHMPTVLTFLLLILVIATGVVAARRRLHRSAEVSEAL